MSDGRVKAGFLLDKKQREQIINHEHEDYETLDFAYQVDSHDTRLCIFQDRIRPLTHGYEMIPTSPGVYYFEYTQTAYETIVDEWGDRLNQQLPVYKIRKEKIVSYKFTNPDGSELRER